MTGSGVHSVTIIGRVVHTVSMIGCGVHSVAMIDCGVHSLDTAKSELITGCIMSLHGSRTCVSILFAESADSFFTVRNRVFTTGTTLFLLAGNVPCDADGAGLSSSISG